MSTSNPAAGKGQFSFIALSFLDELESRARRDPDWSPGHEPFPSGLDCDEVFRLNEWLVRRYADRIRNHRALESHERFPEFVL